MALQNAENQHMLKDELLKELKTAFAFDQTLINFDDIQKFSVEKVKLGLV